MTPKLVFCCLFLSVLFSVSNAQEKKFALSAPVDLKQVGWNKVLCMKNGNTVLFHMEPDKPIVVKVFDSMHREIASKEHDCSILDIFILKDAIFKGLFEVNGEAVLFMQQDHLSKVQLVRLRFSGTDGSLIEEKLIEQSQSVNKRTYFYTMKNREEEGYAILFSTDVPQFLDCKIHVVYYDKDNNPYRDVSLDVDRKKYDYLHVVDAECRPNGICVVLGMSKMEANSTLTAVGSDVFGAEAVYGHTMGVYYIPKDSNHALRAVVDLSENVFPYNGLFTYNPFAQALNFLLLSYKDISYRNGLEWRPAALIRHLFLKLDEHSMETNYNWIDNKMANAYLQEKTDTTHFYEGLPVYMSTDNHGLSTVISETYTRYITPETRVRTDHQTYLGDIAITQFDDDGNEIWGTILQNIQYLKSYQRYYFVSQLSHKWQSLRIFGDLPEQVYNRQFCSLNAYAPGRDIFIVLNEYDKDINAPLWRPADTIFDFYTTNACYYKLDRKKEITKHYLYGQPAAGEYMTSFLEGADFDEQRGMYVSLVQCRKDKKTTLCMAWSKLD